MDKKLIQAMLDGKELVFRDMRASYTDFSKTTFRQWCCSSTHYGDSKPMDFTLDWQLKPEPKTRPMTNGEAMVFCADNPRVVIRQTYNNKRLISDCYGFFNIRSDHDIDTWLWNELLNDGSLMHEEWKKFEVVDNE